MQIQLPEAVAMKLADIHPYANNPRRITSEAVQAVKDSIERYGYVQPIALRKATLEVVVGHTRLRALQELGVEECQVYLLDITEQQAKEYRLVDNRTNEMSEWDHKSLVLELREWDAALLDAYFPDVSLEVGLITDALVTLDDTEKASDAVTSIKEARVDALVKVTCPSCFHAFQVKAASLPGLSQNDVDLMNARAQG
jgi:hypothetical protein